MSNYNLTLQSNNTNLQAILDVINELPEAGSDTPNIETCTVTIVSNEFGVDGTAYIVTYEDNRFDISEWPLSSEAQNVCQNSNILFNGIFNYSVDSEDGTSYYEGLGRVHIGTSNTTITVTLNGGNPFE